MVLMKPDTARRVEQRVAGYDFGYVGFVRRFPPQDVDRREESRFFASLALYVPLLLSSAVELRRVASIPSSFCYGVFAKGQLSAGYVSAIRGELVKLEEEEYWQLKSSKSSHSLLRMAAVDMHRTRVPDGRLDPAGERDRRAERRASRRPRTARSPSSAASSPFCYFVVAGGVSLINHACEQHSNAWPCVWKDDCDVGAAQWKVITLKRDIAAGEEIWLDYTPCDEGEEKEEAYECMQCGQLAELAR